MKKGQIFKTKELMKFPVYIIIFAGVLAIISFLVGSAVSQEIDISSLENEILILRIIYSKDCFALEDIRVYPGIIDLNKFTNERLKNCLNSEYDFKVSLEKSEKIALTENFEFKEERCDLEYSCIKKKYYILLANGENDILNVEMIREK